MFMLAFLMQIALINNAYTQDDSLKTSTISFFLDCEACDFVFVRQELPFVSFVRDPKVADVHILVTHSHTGGGGNKYFLNFIGLGKFKEVNYEYELSTQPSDTEDDLRKSLLKVLKIGILSYYSNSGLLDKIIIDIKESDNQKAQNLVIDPWDKWVFSIESGGDFQKEESQNDFSLMMETGIRKVTDEWKVILQGNYEINRETFYDNGEEITNNQDTKELYSELVKSLTSKWSAALFGSYASRTFNNIRNNYEFAAGIEYNLFPWSESNRRVFSIGYGGGINYFDYNEETIYNKINETLFSESVRVNIDLKQPWGEISFELEGRHYFHDFSKNRLTLESDFSVRLTRNLSIYCELQSNIIHDQLYLPKKDASLTDILLERRKLATTYEIRSELGIRFTFGSIYNNIVNERF